MNAPAGQPDPTNYPLLRSAFGEMHALLTELEQLRRGAAMHTLQLNSLSSAMVAQEKRFTEEIAMRDDRDKDVRDQLHHALDSMVVTYDPEARLPDLANEVAVHVRDVVTRLGAAHVAARADDTFDIPPLPPQPQPPLDAVLTREAVDAVLAPLTDPASSTAEDDDTNIPF